MSRDAIVKAWAIRQEEKKRHRNIWAHRCTIGTSRSAASTTKKRERTKEKQERERDGGGREARGENGGGRKRKWNKVASRRRGRRRGTEAYLPPTYIPSRGFWRILGVPGTMVEAQSWVWGSKPGRRTEDADAHRPLDPPCAGVVTRIATRRRKTQLTSIPPPSRPIYTPLNPHPNPATLRPPVCSPTTPTLFVLILASRLHTHGFGPYRMPSLNISILPLRYRWYTSIFERNVTCELNALPRVIACDMLEMWQIWK